MDDRQFWAEAYLQHTRNGRLQGDAVANADGAVAARNATSPEKDRGGWLIRPEFIKAPETAATTDKTNFTGTPPEPPPNREIMKGV